MFRTWGAWAMVLSMATAASGQAIKGWGEPLDREGDCAIGFEGGVLTIGLSERPHELKPSPGKRNAPRVWKYNEGNFIATVKVELGEGEGERSAGLVLWQDDRNFLRLARGAGDRLVFEYWKDGQLQPTPSGLGELKVEGPQTWLRMTRRASKLQVEASGDGETYRDGGTVPIRLSSRLQLGVHATNEGGKATEVKLEGYVLKPIPVFGP